MPRAAEIRNLVLRQACRGQRLKRRLIHARNSIVGGHQLREVARAAGQHLAAQARVVVHLQHVHAGVRHAALHQHPQRLLPRSRRLPGQPRNQVHIHVCNSRGPQTLNVVEHHGARMQPAAHLRLAVNKRLHAQAHARNTRRNQSGQRLIGKLARRALYGDFHIRRHRKLPTHRREQPLDQVRLQQARRPAAQINRVHHVRNFRIEFSRPIGRPVHLI